MRGASGGTFPDGLLGKERQKTGWMRAETARDPGPWRQQAILDCEHWDAEDALRDIMRDFALETLADDDAVFVVDETGFLKQGKGSCGVARQYTGSAEKIMSCQIDGARRDRTPMDVFAWGRVDLAHVDEMDRDRRRIVLDRAVPGPREIKAPMPDGQCRLARRPAGLGRKRQRRPPRLLQRIQARKQPPAILQRAVLRGAHQEVNPRRAPREGGINIALAIGHNRDLAQSPRVHRTYNLNRLSLQAIALEPTGPLIFCRVISKLKDIEGTRKCVKIG